MRHPIRENHAHIIGVYTCLPKVEQGVDISPQQKAIRDMVRVWAAVGNDMTGLKGKFRVVSGDGALTAVSLK